MFGIKLACRFFNRLQSQNSAWAYVGQHKHTHTHRHTCVQAQTPRHLLVIIHKSCSHCTENGLIGLEQWKQWNSRAADCTYWTDLNGTSHHDLAVHLEVRLRWCSSSKLLQSWHALIGYFARLSCIALGAALKEAQKHPDMLLPIAYSCDPNDLQLPGQPCDWHVLPANCPVLLPGLEPLALHFDSGWARMFCSNSNCEAGVQRSSAVLTHVSVMFDLRAFYNPQWAPQSAGFASFICEVHWVCRWWSCAPPSADTIWR